MEFRPNDFVVYPAHGVGQIISIEEQEIAGLTLELFVISFEKDKMTLRVPVGKVADSGLRKISSKDKMQAVTATLKGRARSKRTMWSRRAQEYEAKIDRLNSRIRDLSGTAGPVAPEPETSRKGFFRR